MSDPQLSRTHFTTTNIALIGVFSAVWVILTLTIAPLGFAFLHLPVIHSLIIFLLLILITWATEQFGAASLVSIIGSAIVVLVNPSILPVLGFVPAAILFDLALLVNHHRVNVKPSSIGIVIVASILCAYVAGLINGLFILPNLAWIYVVTVWGGWNILGAVIGVAATLPIIAVLEKADVKKVKAEL